MAFDDEFLDLMPHTVTVRRRSESKDRFGNPTFGDPVTWQCRVERRTRRVGVLGNTGTVTYAKAVELTLIGPYVTPEWEPGDEFTVDGATRVLDTDALEVVDDDEGPHHMVVTLANA